MKRKKKTDKIGPRGSRKRHAFFVRIGRKGGKAGKGRPKRKRGKGLLRNILGR